MKRLAWMLAAPLALAALAMPAMAQSHPFLPRLGESGFFSRFCQRRPAVMLGTPAEVVVDPKKKTETPVPQPQPQPMQDTPPGETPYKGSVGLGTNVSAGFGVGASVAAAAAGLPIPQANATSATITSNTTPLIFPGLFTAAVSQSAVPTDRVFFEYGYTDRFAVAGPTGPRAGFNLNTYTIGVEKTFFDNMASIYVSVPFLDATSNRSGQPIDGIGNVNAGFKILFWRDMQTGSALSGGFTVSAPTGRDTEFRQRLDITFTGGTQPALVPNPPPVGTILTATQTTRLNPTYLQPYVAGLWVRDRLFVHEYFGVIVPTDSRVATIINNNLTIGYEIYNNPNGMLRTITPIAGVQLLLPTNHVNNSATPTTTTVAANITCLDTTIPSQLANQAFGFPNQVFLSGGAQFGLGDRALFSAGVVVPVAGPRGFNIGVSVGLNYFY
jgi:hypothetical protein